MSTKHDISRREVIGGTAAMVAASALAPIPANAQGTEAAVRAFYQSREFTYCDAKILAEYWKPAPDVNSPWDAKVSAGKKILNGIYDALKQDLKLAAADWRKKGKKCKFDDANNPAYTYDDAAKLAKLWDRGMTPYDAKIKIALNLEGGGNLWVLSELKKAK